MHILSSPAWGDAQQKAFDTIIQRLAHPTTLAYPDVCKPFHVHTDASDVALGATLSQEDDQGQLRLIACMSKKLHAAECNYPAHERELLALVEALKYWRVYLWGAVVKAYTDNLFMRDLKTCGLNSPRQVRWVSIIETYNVQFTHIPGTTHTADDALSRLKGAMAPILPLEPAEDWTELYTSRDTPIAGFAP